MGFEEFGILLVFCEVGLVFVYIGKKFWVVWLENYMEVEWGSIGSIKIFFLLR